jgi:hypothetical protein
MSEKMVTVATYAQMFEADLARNLLEREGIQGIISGDPTASALFGVAANAIRLQVQEGDAHHAAGILAAYAAEAALDRDWEERAESGQDVWVCSICGEPVSNHLSTCYSCATPREGIRAVRTTPSTDVQAIPRARPEALARRPVELEPDEDVPPVSAAVDTMARRALIASVFTLVGVGLLLPFACYYLVRVLLYTGELSPVGLRRFCWALFLSAISLLGWGLWFLSYLPLVR